VDDGRRSKELERFAKVRLLRKDGDGLSAIEPVQYQRRFMDNLEFITRDVATLADEDPQAGVAMSTSGRVSLSDCNFGGSMGGNLPKIRAGGSMEEEGRLLSSTSDVDGVDESVEALQGPE
jgi:hypothetical protein